MEWKNACFKLGKFLTKNKQDQLIKYFTNKTPNVHILFENSNKDGNIDACIRTASNLGIQSFNFINSIGNFKSKEQNSDKNKSPNHKTSGGYSKWIDLKTFNSFSECLDSYRTKDQEILIVSTALNSNNDKLVLLSDFENKLQQTQYRDYLKYLYRDYEEKIVGKHLIEEYLSCILKHEEFTKLDYARILAFNECMKLIRENNLTNVDVENYSNSLIEKYKELSKEEANKQLFECLCNSSLFNDFKFIYHKSNSIFQKESLLNFLNEKPILINTEKFNFIRDKSFMLRNIQENFHIYKEYFNLSPNKEKIILICFGNELRGLSNHILDKSDLFLKIPEFGFDNSSYNLSVSFAIVAYHLHSKGLIPGSAFDFNDNELIRLLGKSLISFFLDKNSNYFKRLGITNIEGI